MGWRVAARFDGLEQFADRLKLLKATLQKRVLRSAMRKSASVVNKAAKANAPKRTGQLRRSLGVKVKAYPSGVVIGVVEPRAGFRVPAGNTNGKPKFIDPRFYAHLVEGGVKPHAVGKGSSLRKRSQGGKLHPGAPAQPFLRPAFESNTARIVEIFGDEIDQALAKL